MPTVSGFYSALPLNVGIAYQANGKGTDDFRLGNTLLAHVGTEYQFTNRVSLLLQVNGRFQDYSYDIFNLSNPFGQPTAQRHSRRHAESLAAAGSTRQNGEVEPAADATNDRDCRPCSHHQRHNSWGGDRLV
ncbi:MAG: hypothetical protein ACREOO_21760 [bacterium]